jgi:hypothetical protein
MLPPAVIVIFPALPPAVGAPGPTLVPPKPFAPTVAILSVVMVPPAFIVIFPDEFTLAVTMFVGCIVPEVTKLFMVPLLAPPVNVTAVGVEGVNVSRSTLFPPIPPTLIAVPVVAPAIILTLPLVAPLVPMALMVTLLGAVIVPEPAVLPA